MLIKRVYELDPLTCEHCGGAMKVLSFIEPPQRDVIERILKHCGLWDPRPPPGDCPDFRSGKMGLSPSECPDATEAIRELTYVDEDTFWATF